MHRDVKPGNLLRRRDGVVKLADFGIAKAAEQSDITKVGSVLGTAAYLSPEQARGEPAGPASDLYALGVVAYQLLAGRLPYEAGVADRPRAPAGDRPAAARSTSSTATSRRRWPSAVARRAGTATPSERYADAAEMEDALRDGLRGRAPATEATWAAEDTDATRMLSPTGATRRSPRTSQTAPHRQLEPIAEPPPPRRAPARRQPAPPPRKKKSGAGSWLFAGLLVVLALVAGGVRRLPGAEQLQQQVGPAAAGRQGAGRRRRRSGFEG